MERSRNSLQTGVFSKADLRRQFRTRRRALSEGPEGRERCRRLQCRLLASSLWKRCRRVALYSAVNGEPDTALLLDAAWKSGREVFLPRCRPDQPGEMDMIACTGPEALVVSRLGIPEPVREAGSHVLSEDDCHAGAATLIVTPALTFDRQGYRLGYGGGYYDRLFARAACSSVGLTFHDLLEAELPHDPWDKPVKAICTEDEMLLL